MTVPVISVVGWHNAGKTTFIEWLVVALKARGLRVGTIKHSGGHIAMDREGTDTWRFREAGSDIVGIASSRQAVVQLWSEGDLTLWQLLDYLPDDLDLLIVEGYKRLPIPKVVVAGGGSEADRGVLESLPEAIAIVGGSATQDAQAGHARYDESDVDGVIHLLEAKGYLARSHFA